MSRDKRVDEYIKEAAPFARPILTRVRKVVHAACPDIVETMKWGAPFFDYKGIVCGMAGFKQHCALIFWKAALLDTEGVKGTDATGQFRRIRSLADLPREAQLVSLVKQAAALNEQGIKAPRRKSPPKATARTPADLLTALKKNPKAFTAFEALSPSHRREYIEWITEAKGEDTRRRRVLTAVAWIAEGKPRNWKYIPAARGSAPQARRS
jgi:uncharacterized protein YdeI (YjbR/CyaY-like superfamily)